jgi:simple sugar transport system substrate-binding protein
MKKLKQMLAVMLMALVPFSFAQDLDPNREITVGFIYVGPVGDAGWTFAHDLGRQKLVEALPNVKTLTVESVAEADAESAVDQLVADGANIIFATSFGYGDGILAAAERYPDVIFGHATGYQRAPNVMTYIAEMYQGYYINGLIAGALTESGLIGYPAAFPIPEVKRHINAFALGALEVNPEAKVEVTWLNAWFAPDAAKEATEALISKGADVFAFTEDTPSVIQTAAAKGFPSFSHYASMYKFSPETVASGQLCNWETIYIDFVSKVLSGEYNSTNLEDVDYVYLMKENALEVGADVGMPINPVYEEALKAKMVNDPELGEISVYDLIMKRIEQLKAGEFEPFTGPITDRKGNEVYAEGAVATIPELMSLEWAAPNVVGDWDREP